MTSTTRPTTQFEWGQSGFTTSARNETKGNATISKSQSLSPIPLHYPTPSPMKEAMIPQVPMAKGSDTSEGSEKVEAAVKDIEGVNYYATGERSKSIYNISPMTWAKLRVASESLGRRLEYRSPENTVVVTHPSGVHEAIHVLCKPFTQIAQAPAYEKDFLVEWNRDVSIPLPDSEFLQLTPDFAFGEKHDPKPKYRMLFECAWSQPDSDLDSKADDWFLLDDVLVVVCLHITEDTKFTNPAHPGDQYSIRSEREFSDATATRTPLGAVVFENKIWVDKLRTITLKIHYRQHAMEPFSLMPPPPGEDTTALKMVQETVDSRLARVLKDIMTIERLRDYLAAQDTPFNLNWDMFYEDLDKRLLAEGYRRYTEWVGTRVSRRSLKRPYPRDRSLLPAPQTEEEVLDLVRKKVKLG